MLLDRQIYLEEIIANFKLPTYSPELPSILAILVPRRNDRQIALWFMSANGYLGGPRPIDVIRERPDLVLLAAKDDALGIHHG
jgi:hypothetical protein